MTVAQTTLPDAQALAEAACRSMADTDTDACSRWLGMRVEAVGPGYAAYPWPYGPNSSTGTAPAMAG